MLCFERILCDCGRSFSSLEWNVLVPEANERILYVFNHQSEFSLFHDYAVTIHDQARSITLSIFEIAFHYWSKSDWDLGPVFVGRFSCSATLERIWEIFAHVQDLQRILRYSVTNPPRNSSTLLINTFCAHESAENTPIQLAYSLAKPDQVFLSPAKRSGKKSNTFVIRSKQASMV